jgi:hypothetical protein
LAIATNSTILNILINGDASGAIRALDQAGASAEGAGAKFSAIGGKLTAGLTVPLLGIGAAGVMAASNLNEAASKVDVVFGSAQGTVEAFAESSAESFGLSERAALEAAGTLGNLVVSMGGTQQAAADMSTDLLGLAGDLASFNNLDTDDVLEKIRSGLVGEVEPLRALGVNFNAAQVEASAMAIAIGDGRNEITEADKVMARYKLIMEQTTTAQGDFARTSDGLANQTRIAQASLEDSAAALGQHLLPIATDAIGIVADLAGAFANLPAPVQDTVVKVGLLAAATGPALFVGAKLVTGLGAVANAAILGAGGLSTYTGKLTSLGGAGAGAIGGVIVGLGLLVVAYDKLNDRQQEAAQLADGARDAIVQGGDEAVAAFIRTESAAHGVTDIIGENTDLWAKYLDGVRGGGEGLDVFVGQLANNSSALQAYREALTLTDGNLSSFAVTLALAEDEGVLSRGQIVDLAQAVGLLGGALAEGASDADALAASQRAEALAASDVKNQQDLAAHAIMGHAAAAREQAAAQEEVERAIRTTSGVLNTYLGRLGELQGSTLGVSEAQIAFIEASNAAAIATYTNGQNLDLNTQQGRDNQQALNDLARAVLDHATAVEGAGGSQEEYTAALDYGRQAFVDQAVAMGLGRVEADRLAVSLGLIPPLTSVAVEVDTPDTTALENIGAAIAQGIATGIDNNAHLVGTATSKLVVTAVDAAQATGKIHSPSVLFAEQVGGPISEGVAKGILDALDAPQSAIDDLFDELVSRANEGAGNVLGGIGAVFSSGDAQSRLTNARSELASARSPADIAKAQADLQDAQLGVLRASQALVEAGQELLSHPGGEAQVRQLAQLSGLTGPETDALLAKIVDATSFAGQFLPGDVSSLVGGGGGSAPVTNNITINTGADPDAVVAAIRRYERSNGAVLLA